MSGSTLDDARSAKLHALAAFSSLADVVGVGITSDGDGFALKVNLRQAPPPGIDLPTAIDGVRVKVEVVGPLRKR